jgi:hypothetical protein
MVVNEIGRAVEIIEVGKQRPFVLDQTVTVDCLLDRCVNGKPYTYCKFSKDGISYAGEYCTFFTFYYQPSDGTGICGYTVNPADDETTESQIQKFCST